ncbi:MAG: ATP-binding cassette domain-containing protein [Phycisphaerae bacterium]|nr:ATP-binding cassette domain-containing protein [Phycisphaerae bacterium]
MKAMIEVENLTKYYGPVLAVDRISFTVPEGKIVGFLGPNGAGKSTTLKILTCYLSASDGRASVAGYNVFSQSLEVRRRIGYLPENVPLYPDMKVKDYLKFRAELKNIPAKQRKITVEQAADRCWLRSPTNMMERRIDQLSKGYRQRVGLADAIMHEPAVLVLDEPTIGLDPTQIRETRHLIQELGQQHTIILSSHILPEVEQTCSEIIIIAGGKIIANGTPASLRDQVTTGRLVLEVRGAETAAMVKSLAAVNGVKKVDVAAEGQWARLAVTPAAGQDPRTELFKAVAGAGWQLREIRRESGSLEDFFVQVTAQQQLREKTAVA